MSAPSLQREEKYAIGTRIRKQFGDLGSFEGVIASFDGDHYRIHYSDGDKGDMSESEFDHSDVEMLSDEEDRARPQQPLKKRPSKMDPRGSRPIKKRRRVFRRDDEDTSSSSWDRSSPVFSEDDDLPTPRQTLKKRGDNLASVDPPGDKHPLRAGFFEDQTLGNHERAGHDQTETSFSSDRADSESGDDTPILVVNAPMENPQEPHDEAGGTEDEEGGGTCREDITILTQAKSTGNNDDQAGKVHANVLEETGDERLRSRRGVYDRRRRQPNNQKTPLEMKDDAKRKTGQDPAVHKKKSDGKKGRQQEAVDDGQAETLANTQHRNSQKPTRHDAGQSTKRKKKGKVSSRNSEQAERVGSPDASPRQNQEDDNKQTTTLDPAKMRGKKKKSGSPPEEESPEQSARKRKISSKSPPTRQDDKHPASSAPASARGTSIRGKLRQVHTDGDLHKDQKEAKSRTSRLGHAKTKKEQSPSSPGTRRTELANRATLPAPSRRTGKKGISGKLPSDNAPKVQREVCAEASPPKDARGRKLQPPSNNHGSSSDPKPAIGTNKKGKNGQQSTDGADKTSEKEVGIAERRGKQSLSNFSSKEQTAKSTKQKPSDTAPDEANKKKRTLNRLLRELADYNLVAGAHDDEQSDEEMPEPARKNKDSGEVLHNQHQSFDKKIGAKPPKDDKQELACAKKTGTDSNKRKSVVGADKNEKSGNKVTGANSSETKLASSAGGNEKSHYPILRSGDTKLETEFNNDKLVLGAHREVKSGGARHGAMHGAIQEAAVAEKNRGCRVLEVEASPECSLGLLLNAQQNLETATVSSQGSALAKTRREEVETKLPVAAEVKKGSGRQPNPDADYKQNRTRGSDRAFGKLKGNNGDNRKNDHQNTASKASGPGAKKNAKLSRLLREIADHNIPPYETEKPVIPIGINAAEDVKQNKLAKEKEEQLKAAQNRNEENPQLKRANPKVEKKLPPQHKATQKTKRNTTTHAQTKAKPARTPKQKRDVASLPPKKPKQFKETITANPEAESSTKLPEKPEQAPDPAKPNEESTASVAEPANKSTKKGIRLLRELADHNLQPLISKTQHVDERSASVTKSSSSIIKSSKKKTPALALGISAKPKGKKLEMKQKAKLATKVHAPAKKSKKRPPKFAIGTLFFKKFDGDRYGGVICSFDGQYYKVRYPQDGDEEELSDSDFGGSDIEVLSGSTDSSDDDDAGPDSDHTDCDTEDSIDDENGIFDQVTSAPPHSKKSGDSSMSHASKFLKDPQRTNPRN